MRLLLSLLFLASCMPDFGAKKHEGVAPYTKLLISGIDYHVDTSEGLKLDLTIQGLVPTLKDLRKSVFLLKAPTKEALSPEDLSSALPIKLIKPNRGSLEITTKARLAYGSTYGIYFKNQEHNQIELIYTFLAKPGPAQLESHDLGKDEQLTVDDNRIIFNFSFDQPIYLHDDQAIRLTKLADKLTEVAIESLTVTTDQKSVIVRLKKIDGPVLEAYERYVFTFGESIKNSDKQASEIEPIEFVAVKSSGSLEELEPITLKTSHDGVLFKWALNEKHRTRLLVTTTKEPFDCVTSQCPVINDSLGVVNDNDTWSHRDRLFVSGLTAHRLYRFVMVSEDLSGRVMSAVGSFKTREVETLRISEVMINPRVPGANNDQSGEYIELKNIGDQDVKFDDLRISVEDSESLKLKSCALATSSSPLVITKNSYVLIVANDFKTSLYQLDDSVAIIRLPQKTLCGGLSNLKRKSIWLERGEGHFLDRFGGYKWKTKEGQSIGRINLAGLDEDSNYCYSSIDEGPTPAAINGSCGE